MNLVHTEQPDLATAIKFFSSIVKYLGPYSQQFSFNNPSVQFSSLCNPLYCQSIVKSFECDASQWGGTT